MELQRLDYVSPKKKNLQDHLVFALDNYVRPKKISKLNLRKSKELQGIESTSTRKNIA